MNIDAPRPAMELNKSHFRNGGYDNRKLYEWKDANNKRLGNLGVDIDGKYTVNENTGPGESWIYEEGSGEASIESVNCCYTLTVREDR